jgi:hypothetical protein
MHSGGGGCIPAGARGAGARRRRRCALTLTPSPVLTVSTEASTEAWVGSAWCRERMGVVTHRAQQYAHAGGLCARYQ